MNAHVAAWYAYIADDLATYARTLPRHARFAGDRAKTWRQVVELKRRAANYSGMGDVDGRSY